MSKVIIEALGQELDLAKGIGFGLNYAIDDVKKPENGNSNYSKTITLAGSKNNNKFLGGLFDINADFTFFNPNFKVAARIIIDSSTVMEGFLQLKAIEKEQDTSLDGNLVVYKCVIFSKTADFVTDIKDKQLNELDFSRFSHEYTQPNISNSWSNTSSDVYTYPLLYKNSNSYQTKDFKPAIFHKAYLKRIAQEAGYTLGGSLLDESTTEGLHYSREIVPFNGDLPTIPAAEYTRRLFQAGMSSSPVSIHSGNILGGFVNGHFLGYGKTFTDVTFLDDDSTGSNFDPNGHWNTISNEYTVDADGSYNIDISIEHELTHSTASLVANQSLYASNFSGSDTFRQFDLDYEFNLTYRILKNGNFIGWGSSNTLNAPIGSGGNPAFYAGNGYSQSQNVTAQLNIPNLYLLDTDVITIEYSTSDTLNPLRRLDYTVESTGNAPLTEVSVAYDLSAINTGGVTFIKNTTNTTALTDGDTVSLNEYIPKEIKQSDIITDLVKRYNAYISIDPDNDRKIIIDTRDSYYSKGTNLDWTDKKDFSNKDTIKLLSELQTKEFNFTYKSDDDLYNENYSDSVSGDIYGEKKIEFSNEFAEGTKKIETPFSPTPLIYNSGFPVAIVPAISTLEPQTNMRVLYFGGVINTIGLGTWDFVWTSGGVTNTTSYTTYPYAGHYDNPFTPTIDLNFGNIPYAWYSEATNSTNGNLYNRFWSNYINQIDEGKLVTMKINLNEVDINFIRNNLNSRVFIRDAWYYINKIVDYNPITLGVTTVEFLKIPDGIAYVQDLVTEVNPFTFAEGKSRLEAPKETLLKNIDLSEDSNIIGSNNVISSGANKSTISGSNNYIGKGSESSVIHGDNNSISEGVLNGFIIGANGKTITESGSGWIGEEQFKDGEILGKLHNRIVVNQDNKDETLGGVIDSTKEYFLDEIIDMGTTSITVPAGGLTLRGHSFDISGLSSNADNYTMFVSESPVNGSGDLLGFDYLIAVTGTNSKVYELYDDTGFNAFEFARINYMNCTSLGDIHNYRQGLEFGTGRFGGTPTLTFHGTWLGGFRCTTSIVRGLEAGVIFSLFAEGTSFLMNSRFLTDINVDLPNRGILLDFVSDNFANPSTLQLKGCTVTRDGVTDPTDTNLTPNITRENLVCDWDNNVGLPNTFIGGIKTLTTEVLTSITGGAGANRTLMLGTWTNTELQHFDSNFNYSLRHLGTNPIDFKVTFDFILEGNQSDEYTVTLVKDNGGVLTDEYSQTRTIDRLQGGRDVAYFTGSFVITIENGAFLYWEVENITDNSNCTLETSSQFLVEER